VRHTHAAQGHVSLLATAPWATPNTAWHTALPFIRHWATA